MSMGVLTVSKTDFDRLISDSNVPVLIDFWAGWCAPCKRLGAELENLKNDLGESLVIGKINVDDEPDLADRFGVQSIPNIMLFKDGKPVHQVIGFLDAASLKLSLSPFLQAAKA